MSKKCPECGEELPNQAHFCGNCGYDFFKSSDSKPMVSNNGNGIFSNSKLFLVLIAIVIIVCAAIVLSMGFGGNHDVVDDSEKNKIDLTVADVNGYDGSSDDSYTLYTSAIFNKVPSDLKGYNIKTTYFDKNGTEIGHETEKLSNVYYDSDYAISFGHYTTYKKPNPDHVNVEILKEGKTIGTFNSTIDQGKIKFLN